MNFARENLFEQILEHWEIIVKTTRLLSSTYTNYLLIFI